MTAPTDTMRNRMARAIYERDHPKQLCELPWERQDDEYRDVYRGFVDAILSVLSDPTDAMLRAGASALDHPAVGGPSVASVISADRTWRAMVASIKAGA